MLASVCLCDEPEVHLIQRINEAGKQDMTVEIGGTEKRGRYPRYLTGPLLLDHDP